MEIIGVTNLGKAYKQYPSQLARVAEWLFPFAGVRHQLKWVLKEINFTVNRGEAMAIIGVNGAGKSTLLKILTGTTQPTEGDIELSGTIAALLELGMGFHPDFTGRQNVFMAGQLLGLSAEDISHLMHDIEAFAGIGDYIDQPVRIYSSGMQVRLAFSVATARRPDLLIVDEALSVGDAAFQRKCFHRIERYLTENTTLLLVSHDTETVKKICSKAIFLDSGQIQMFDTAKIVCDAYEKFLFGSKKADKKNKPSQKEVSKFDPALSNECEIVYENTKATIESCWIRDQQGETINIVETGKSFSWCYRVRFNESVVNPVFAMLLKTREGISLYGVDSKHLGISGRLYTSGETIDINFSLSNSLAPGIYYFNCGVLTDSEEGVEFLSRRIDAKIIRVVPGESASALVGVVDLKARLSITPFEAIEE